MLLREEIARVEQEKIPYTTRKNPDHNDFFYITLLFYYVIKVLSIFIN